jgi:hypothetical protein
VLLYYQISLLEAMIGLARHTREKNNPAKTVQQGDEDAYDAEHIMQNLGLTRDEASILVSNLRELMSKREKMIEEKGQQHLKTWARKMALPNPDAVREAFSSAGTDDMLSVLLMMIVTIALVICFVKFLSSRKK